MPLTDEFPNAVKLILRTKVRQGDSVQGIAGHGLFVASMESKTFGSALRHLYLVTAAQCRQRSSRSPCAAAPPEIGTTDDDAR